MLNECDRQVGELFRRLSIFRVELGEPAFERAIRAVLATIGAAALEEAERRARIVTLRGAPSHPTLAVTPFARRAIPDPVGED